MGRDLELGGPAAGLALGFTAFETRADVIVRVAHEVDRLGFVGIGMAEAMGYASPPVLADVALAPSGWGWPPECCLCGLAGRRCSR